MTFQNWSMDACAIIVFSPILRERNLCRSKQYIFYSSSGALAYRLCSPHSTWSHLYRMFFELRGKSAFLHLREKKDRILAWLIILLQWHSAFVKKDKSRKKSNLAECECTWTWKFTKCQLLSTDVHSYYKSRVHSKWKAKCRVLDMINSFSAYWTKKW